MNEVTDLLLSRECESILDSREWCSGESLFGTGIAVILDDEGTRLFEVTRAISAFDLSQLLRYADMRYRHGKSHGESELQAKLRGLIGAQATPEEPA